MTSYELNIVSTQPRNNSHPTFGPDWPKFIFQFDFVASFRHSMTSYEVNIYFCSPCTCIDKISELLHQPISPDFECTVPIFSWFLLAFALLAYSAHRLPALLTSKLHTLQLRYIIRLIVLYNTKGTYGWHELWLKQPQSLQRAITAWLSNCIN